MPTNQPACPTMINLKSLVRKYCGYPIILGVLAIQPCSSFATLTGEYLFEEGSGTLANDNSGFDRDGTLTGGVGVPLWAPGLYNGSINSLHFNFDSVNLTNANRSQLQRVQLPGTTAFVQNAPAMTLAAWVQFDTPVAGTQSIIGVSETGGGTRGVLQVLASGQVRMLGRRVDGGNNSNYVTSGGNPFVVTPNTPIFLVGIMDYANQDIRVYINGVLHTGGGLNVASLAGGTTSVNSPNLSAFIGTSAIGAAEGFGGYIDGARIWDHALTGSEILDLYNAEVVPEPSILTLAGLAGLFVLRRRR
jgi:hypothetical protein